MTPTASSPLETSSQNHEAEARLLAELLRTSRLTLLYCEAGIDKTAFLTSVLMPLLGRPAGEPSPPTPARESGEVVPLPDPGTSAPGTRSIRKRELVVHFDDWSGAPLPALLRCIDRVAHIDESHRSSAPLNLGDTLEALGSRLNAHFMILLDRFEECLKAPSDHEGHIQFTHECVDAILRDQLPASFLISLDDDASPRLAGLRDRLPGLGDYSLKLKRPSWWRASATPWTPPEPVVTEQPAPPTQRVAAPGMVKAAFTSESAAGSTVGDSARRPKASRSSEPRLEVNTQDVYALIEATLARTAASKTGDPFQPEADTADLASSPARPEHAETPQATPPRGLWRSVWGRVSQLCRIKRHPHQQND